MNVMQSVLANLGPIYWLYFASFIVIGTFIIINLFGNRQRRINVQRESGIPLTQQEVMHEIREIRRIL